MTTQQAICSQAERMRITSLMQMASLINSSLDPEEIRRTSVNVATSCVGADAASLLLIDKCTGELCFEVVTGSKSDYLEHKRMKPGEGIAGWIARRGGAVIVDDVKKDGRFNPVFDELSGYDTRNMIVVPVYCKGNMLGVLQAINKLEGAFSEDDLEMLETVANLVGTAMENALLFQEQREIFLGITTAFAEALEQRDTYTGGHTHRVRDYSIVIAHQMGLSPEECNEINLSAILHDIGKIGVSDKVLQKPGKLDHNEFLEMSRHPECGAEILEHVKSLRNMLGGVRHHHERFDGNGYPDRIHGENIPLIARIISVADAFDAMTSTRAYRNALPHETALKELNDCSGKQFDPLVVAAFVEAYKQGEISSLWNEYSRNASEPC